MTEGNSERINLPIPKSLIDAIDDWRRRQPEIPPRAAAIRRLIEKGLESDALEQGHKAAAISSSFEHDAEGRAAFQSTVKT